MSDPIYITNRSHRRSPVFNGQTVCRLMIPHLKDEAPEGTRLCTICYPRGIKTG